MPSDISQVSRALTMCPWCSTFTGGDTLISCWWSVTGRTWMPKKRSGRTALSDAPVSKRCMHVGAKLRKL